LLIRLSAIKVAAGARVRNHERDCNTRWLSCNTFSGWGSGLYVLRRRERGK